MKVDEKCDVYSFGVVVLEVLLGRHPGDFISSLMSMSSSSSSASSSSALSSSTGRNTLLKGVLDQRLPPPEDKFAEGVAHAVKLALSCLFSDPRYRPTMRQVSSELTTLRASLPKPFPTIELNDVLLDRNAIGWTFTVFFPLNRVKQSVMKISSIQWSSHQKTLIGLNFSSFLGFTFKSNSSLLEISLEQGTSKSWKKFEVAEEVFLESPKSLVAWCCMWPNTEMR